MKKTGTFIPSPSIVSVIAQLPELSMAEIKDLWSTLFPFPPPNHVRAFLERRLAFQLQDRAFRREHPGLAERNEKRIEEIQSLDTPSQRNRPIHMIPGTVLTRIYQNVEYRVIIQYEGKFEFDGRIYSSLSKIAREITGTRWSGPLFFGLRQPTFTTKAKRKSKSSVKPNIQAQAAFKSNVEKEMEKGR